MSVFMILRIEAAPDALEEFGRANAELMTGVAQAGQKAGATRHAFAAGEGEVLVIDEWPDEASFRNFFDSQPDIPRIMQAAGAKGKPEITFYRKLDMPDEF
jgi:quinol monooxygenase YgiN